MAQLRKIGIWFHGKVIRNGDVSVDELVQYIDLFDKASELCLIGFDALEDYNYYYDCLYDYANLYPKFDYCTLLEKKHSDIMGMFYGYVRQSKEKYYKEYYY